ncbi:hypothetical protein DBA29_20355 [Xenophilus aerolatus]|nr:hypothetical protein [Xenophilus aerolatus]
MTNDAEFDGLIKLIGSDSAFASQKLDKANAALTLDMLDELVDQVKAAKAQFIMAAPAAVRKIKSLMRASGGVEYRELSGEQVASWNGIPIFVNDFMASDYVTGTAGNQTHIIAGCFDDGTRKLGVSGVIPQSGGLTVDDVGFAEASDFKIMRVKMYATMAVHSTKSVAGLWNVGI